MTWKATFTSIGRTGRAGREGRAFTFVTMRENYKLRDIIRYTRARISQGRLPTLRDVANIRTSRLLEEIRLALETGTLERWLTLVEEFLAEQFPDGGVTSMDMAAAMLKLLMQRDFGDQDGAEVKDDWAERTARPSRRQRDADRPREREGGPGERRQRPDMTMTGIRLNVGHMHGVTPREIVGAIAGECGIPGRCIGAIDIRNDSCVVDIAGNLADDVLAVLNTRVFISGTRVEAKKSDGTAGSSSRGPLAPGGRRQHSGKFGKKPRGATTGRKLYREPTRRPESSPRREESPLRKKRLEED